MILVVTYDLKGKRSYTPLYETLEEQGDWAHFIAATWFIQTDRTPQEVYEAIAPHVNKNDSVFIGTLSNGYEGFLPDKAWKWLKKRGLKP
jgi:hypothetical protein